MAIQNISPKQALEKSNAGTILVDVREKNETDCAKYGASTVVYLPLSELDKKFIALLPQDKNTEIIIACQAGGRSMIAAGFLLKNGYNNLLNLDGGLSRWTAEGLPTKGEESSKSDCCSKPGCC
jgi:rhodanese-related sulfurtransferase